MSVEALAIFWLRKVTFDDFRRLWAAWKFEMHGDIDGVFVWLLLRSHWSSSWRSSTADGPPLDFWTVGVKKLVEIDWIFQFQLTKFAFVEQFEGSGQIPPLNRSIAVASEQESSWPRSHSSARTFAFMNAERSDCCGIDRLYHTNAVAFRGQSNKKLVCIRNNFLNHNLLVVLFPERSKVVASKVSVVCFDRFKWNDFVWSFRRRSRLCADHSTESCDPPSPNVIVFTTHRDEIFLWQRHFDHRRLMNCEGLKELWAMPNCLWMLYNHFHSATLRAISDFNPIPRQTLTREN